MWKSICKGMDSFFRFITFKIINGEGVRFWHDPWCIGEPVYTLFPSCYDLAVAKWGSVREHMVRTRVSCSWNI